MIKKIFVENYKIFDKFELDFNDDLNILVGDNEAGKSTIAYFGEIAQQNGACRTAVGETGW